MPIPKVRTDFNSNSLENRWVLEDLSRQGIELREGMRCVFYDLYCQNNEKGFLHSDGVVWWDETSGVFRIDMSTISLHFTPGEDLSAVTAAYHTEISSCIAQLGHRRLCSARLFEATGEMSFGGKVRGLVLR